MKAGPKQRLLTVFATFGVGGPQVRYTAIANRFPERYSHQIVAMDGVTAAGKLFSPEVAVSYPSLDIRKGDMIGNRRRFRAFVREARPDVLITHNWGSIEWSMANWPRLVPQLHIEDGFGPEEQGNQIRRRVITRRLVLSRTQIVVPSRNLERIATHIWGLSPRRVHYIPNGIDLSRFIPGAGPPPLAGGKGEGSKPKALGITPAAERPQLPAIGTVAALRPEKNLARLIRVFALARASTAASLIIAGDGPERPALETLAASLGITAQIHFTGYVADPAPLFRSFDLFALSSDTEQMPISVIEAMAAGLPVASTDVGDVRVMLAESNAPFVTTRDDQALAEALLTLLRNPALRNSIGASNRLKAEQEYDQETMFQAYARLFTPNTPARPVIP